MGRYIDLAVSVRLADVERVNGRPRWKAGTDIELIRAGGVWDTTKKRWHPHRRARGGIIVRFHRGQMPAALWVCEWLRRWSKDDWSGFKRAWSLLLFGGRASGKTHLICVLFVIFAVLSPGAILWAISPTSENSGELMKNLESVLPKKWRRRWLAKTGRSTRYRLKNGSVILLRSGFKAPRLKAGRVDMALINEAQDQDPAVYTKLRPRIGDDGGIVCLAANPADTVRGLWIERHLDKAKAGEIDGVAFEMDPVNNPFVNYAALASTASEFDTKTYERDILGRRAAPGDVVMYEWRDDVHWKDPPKHYLDVTAEFCQLKLGREFDAIAGGDFQKSPHISARIMRVYRDPEDTLKKWRLWVIGEADVKGNEYALIDELERLGFVGARTAMIMDASAWYQDYEHTPGKTSDRAFRVRHWDHLFKPQQDSDRNPDILERMKSGNALLKQLTLFVARGCVLTADAMRRYENIHGKPNRRSDYAHPIDCITYPTYRLFGVPQMPTVGVAYTPIKRAAPRGRFANL